MEIIKALWVWLICWFIFTLFKLPIPAPWVVAWIVGIIWIYLGFLLCNFILWYIK